AGRERLSYPRRILDLLPHTGASDASSQVAERADRIVLAAAGWLLSRLQPYGPQQHVIGQLDRVTEFHGHVAQCHRRATASLRSRLTVPAEQHGRRTRSEFDRRLAQHDLGRSMRSAMAVGGARSWGTFPTWPSPFMARRLMPRRQGAPRDNVDPWVRMRAIPRAP